ncbi:MAG: PEGA domain-containing protein [Methanoregulaceae archaeon]
MSCPDNLRFLIAGMVLCILCGGISCVSAADSADQGVSLSGGISAIDSYQYSPADPDAAISPVGTIQVTSIPEGAIVTMDEIFADTTPATFANIPAGDHIIEVVMAGHQPWIKKVTVIGGKAIYVDATLKETQSGTGIINITSSPSGADIYIDDIYYGFTPKTIGNQPAGVHAVRLILAGEMSWEGNVTVNSGEETVISRDLIPPTQEKTGSIFIASNPVGAAVYLDGNFVGVTYGGDMIDINNVLPGTHEVTIRMSGYHDYRTTIDVPESKVVHVNPTLVFSQIPHPSGQVQINSVPEGAAVYLDSKFRGYTPLTLQDIEVGQHNIRLKMPGKTDYYDIIRVTAYQTEVVDAVMMDESSASASTGLPSFFEISQLQDWVHTTFSGKSDR